MNGTIIFPLFILVIVYILVLTFYSKSIEPKQNYRNKSVVANRRTLDHAIAENNTNPYELVIKTSKTLERALVDKGASGKGLHEYVSSLENRLEQQLIKKIRYIASVRNQLVHNADFSLTAESKQSFLQAYSYCEKALNLPRTGTASEQFKRSPPKQSKPYIPEDSKKPIWELIKEKQAQDGATRKQSTSQKNPEAGAEIKWEQNQEAELEPQPPQEKRPIWEIIWEKKQR